MSGLKLLLSDARGIYIPRDFVTGFDLSKWTGIDLGDVAFCQDPENEWYWEAWESILNSASHLDDDGNVWRLYQDGDLWAYCEELMSEEEKLSFFDN